MKKLTKEQEAAAERCTPFFGEEADPEDYAEALEGINYAEWVKTLPDELPF